MMPRIGELHVELSGENPTLAEAELGAVVKTLDPGAPPPRPSEWGPMFRQVRGVSAGPLSFRLALAHRVLAFRAEGSHQELEDVLTVEGRSARTGAIRVGGEAPPAAHIALPRSLGRAFVAGGGRVDLRRPEVTYVLLPGPGEGRWGLFEEAARVDRPTFESRRSPRLPFSKPITLPPRLARVVVNLAEVPAGGRLLDPFCGTGALLAEGGLLGCRLVGADIDGTMVRGAMANLAHLGLSPEAVVQADVEQLAETSALREPADGLVGDPPYGRSASTRGETTREVVGKLVVSLPRLLKPGGLAVILLPEPRLPEPLPSGLVEVGEPIPQRVHRSLTRWVNRWRRV